MTIQTNINELIEQLKCDEAYEGFNYDTLLVETLKEILGMEEVGTLCAI